MRSRAQLDQIASWTELLAQDGSIRQEPLYSI
jgi:hypothetical protein